MSTSDSLSMYSRKQQHAVTHSLSKSVSTPPTTCILSLHPPLSVSTPKTVYSLSTPPTTCTHSPPSLSHRPHLLRHSLSLCIHTIYALNNVQSVNLSICLHTCRNMPSLTLSLTQSVPTPTACSHSQLVPIPTAYNIATHALRLYPPYTQHQPSTHSKSR